MSETRFVRGRGGAKVHLSSCRYAVPGHVMPWVWAEDKPVEEWVGKAWLRPCRTCLPDLAALQDRLLAAASSPDKEAGDA